MMRVRGRFCLKETNTEEKFNISTILTIDIEDVDDQYPHFLPCTPVSPRVPICMNPTYTANITRKQQVNSSNTYSQNTGSGKGMTVGLWRSEQNPAVLLIGMWCLNQSADRREKDLVMSPYQGFRGEPELPADKAPPEGSGEERKASVLALQHDWTNQRYCQVDRWVGMFYSRHHFKHLFSLSTFGT